jgi:cell division protein FtsB
MYLCTAVETLIYNEMVDVQELGRLQARVATLEKEKENQERYIKKLQKQADLIAAASRMGWAEAYLFLKEVDINSNENQ